MERVSLTTAQRLKDAGFPQPDVEPGQFWYKDEYYSPAFAPTAADILEQMRGAVLWYPENEGYMVLESISANAKPIGYSTTSAAEACAEAWLSRNNQSQI